MSNGCEHGHGHHGHDHHDHDHDHDHAHDHFEETLEAPWGSVQIEAHTHEQAATVSMVLRPSADALVPFSLIVSSMQRIAEDVEAAGGIVGHVKAFAREGSSFAHASVTAAYLEPALEGGASLGYGTQADIQLVAIALLISQDELVRVCEDALLEPARV